MPAFSCPHCDQRFQVPESRTGQVKCPHCGQAVRLPLLAATVSAPTVQPVPPKPPAAPSGATLPPEAASAADTLGLAPDGAHEVHAFLGPPQAPNELGTLGPYRILKVLGAGGMGVVYEARDPQLQRTVALKVMKPLLAASATARQRFLREAHAIAALEHDHIVTIYQIGEDRGVPFLAMQFLHGETLEDRLRRDGPLPPAEVLRLGSEIADGLAAAHDHGLMHRDVKPANIWLAQRGEGRGARGEKHLAPRVKLLDFGLARAIEDDSHLTQSGAIAGTPAYMAPEQVEGRTVDHRCDLFSLGCVLYRMCTGTPAFQKPTTISTLVSVVQETPKPPEDIMPQLPPALTGLVMQLLAKSPADRPPSAHAVRDALDAIAAGRTTTDPGAVRPSPRGPRRSARRWLVAAAAVALLAVLGAASVLLAPVLIRIPTDKGTLVIESDDPAVEVLVKQGGATIIDRTAKRQLELKPGNYEIELAEVRDGLRLVTKQFTLSRGGRVTVRVHLEPPPDGKRPPPGPVVGRQDRYRSIHGADAAAYQAWIDQLVKTGSRPLFLNGYTVGGQVRFAGIAVKDGADLPWEARHNLTSEQYQETFDQLTPQGYRPISVTGYLLGDSLRFGGIWIRDGRQVDWWARHNLTAAQHEAASKDYEQKGLAPLYVTGYSDGQEQRFSSIFTDDPRPRVGFHDLSAAQYQQEFNAWTGKGYRPLSISGYQVGETTRFAIVLVRDNHAEAWECRHDLTPEAYAPWAERLVARGFHPLVICGYGVDNALRYAAIWVKERPAELPITGAAVPELKAFDEAMRQFMRERAIPAGTLAVMKDGRLVLAHGYGFADRESTRPLAPDAPLRLASVGKPITAAAIRKLIREGKLALDTRVFLFLAVPTPRGRKRDPRLNTITVQHLLDHQGGWDRSLAFDPMFRPLTIAAALEKPGPATSQDVVTYMAGQPLQFAPGTRTAYSNFGYCVLGRVIEKVTGKPYVAYVRTDLLAPLGIKSVELGHTLQAERNPDEPWYMDPVRGPNVMRPDSTAEVPSPDGTFYLEAMDAHGGLIGSSVDLVRFLQAYWITGEPRTADVRGPFTHFGNLPGTLAMVHQRRDGVNLAVLFNQSGEVAGLRRASIREVLDRTADGVKQWPAAK